MSFIPWGLVIGIVITAGIVIGNIVYIRRRGWFKYSGYHIAAYSLLILLLAWFTLCLSISHFSEEQTGWNIVDNIISNYVVVLLFGLVYLWERITRYRHEDQEKLSQRYSDLADRYSAEHLIPCGSLNKTTERYPVVLVGECDIDLTQPEEQLEKQIKIEDEPRKYYQLPVMLAPHFLEIMKAHDASVVYNNLNIRATRMSVEKASDGKADVLSMSTERTYYFHTLVTNRASDYQWNKNDLTVRELFEPGPGLRPLEDSLLSNHLGYNGFIISNDGRIVFVKRKKEVSLGKMTYGDSIGASLKTAFALDRNTGKFHPKGLVRAIYQEIEDELYIERKFISSLRLIAAYRDCVECGKPQLLFCADADCSAQEITEHFLQEEEKKNPKNILVRIKNRLAEFKNRLLGKQNQAGRKKADKSKRAKVKTDGDQLVWIRKEDLNHLAFEPDGIRFTGETQQDHGFCEYRKKDKALHPMKPKKQFLPMVPSASASLVLYLRHTETGKSD